MKTLCAVFGVGAAWLATASAPAAGTGDAMRVFVTIQPQAYFVERVAGSRARVSVLVGPGQEPHTFEPTPRQIDALSDARVYVTIGLPMEAGLLQKVRAVSPGLAIVDSGAGVPRRATAQRGEPAAAAIAGEPDPHIWMSPRLAKLQAANIAAGLSAADPAGATDYAANLTRFQEDLDKLDARITERLAPFRGRSFYVFHPAFEYFAADYGLREVPIETGGREPGAKSLAAVIDRMKTEKAAVVFVEPQFSPKNARAVAAATGAAVETIDDIARDYMANMEDIAEKLQRAFSKR